jgi:FkbM family methyltransferase
MKSLFRLWVDRYFIKQPGIRLAVTRAFERDENQDIVLFGTRLRINTIKEHGYLRAVRKLNFHSVLRDEAGVLVSLSLLICDGDTFVDVGANVGLFVCSLARRRFLSENVRFYAFEANPDTFNRLVESTRDLEVITSQAALSDRAGEAEFLTGAVSHVFTEAANRNDYHFKNQSSTVIKTQRLDESGVKGNSLIIKIDVEGQELKVLNGAGALFDQDRVKAVYLDGYKDDGVTDFLAKRGFSFFDGRTLRPVKSPVFSLLAVKISKFD